MGFPKMTYDALCINIETQKNPKITEKVFETIRLIWHLLMTSVTFNHNVWVASTFPSRLTELQAESNQAHATSTLSVLLLFLQV